MRPTKEEIEKMKEEARDRSSEATLTAISLVATMKSEGFDVYNRDILDPMTGLGSGCYTTVIRDLNAKFLSNKAYVFVDSGCDRRIFVIVDKGKTYLFTIYSTHGWDLTPEIEKDLVTISVEKQQNGKYTVLLKWFCYDEFREKYKDILFSQS